MAAATTPTPLPMKKYFEYYTHLMRGVDLLVFGRKTYQLMVPYWPDVAKNRSETKAEIEFAQTFDSINKIVFSRSLDSAEGNTRIVRTKLRDELLKLKQERGKNIFEYFNRRCSHPFTTYRAWSS
jgi:dihydrofolate reductase